MPQLCFLGTADSGHIVSLARKRCKKRRQQRIYQRKCHSLSAHDSVCDTPILLFGSFVLSCYLLLTVRRFGFARHPFTSVVNLNFGHLKALAALNRDPH